MKRMRASVIVLATVVGLSACSGGNGNKIADCGLRGVAYVHVDNYGGAGTGREIVVCRNGKVFKDG